MKGIAISSAAAAAACCLAVTSVSAAIPPSSSGAFGVGTRGHAFAGLDARGGAVGELQLQLLWRMVFI